MHRNANFLAPKTVARVDLDDVWQMYLKICEKALILVLMFFWVIERVEVEVKLKLRLSFVRKQTFVVEIFCKNWQS